MAPNLSTPLKTVAERRRIRASAMVGGLPWGRIGVLLIAVIVLGAGLWLTLVDDPDGGRPVAQVEIASGGPANAIADALATAPPAGPVTITADPQQFPAGDAGPGMDSGTAVARGAIIPDLIEETSEGGIPRVSAAGLRPFDAYSRPLSAPVQGPRIAMLVTGLGINETGSIQAIERLPDDISLAFAPYGRDLATIVNTARMGGHEVFLEVPLEPFDYPQNDPGPQTLLTGSEPRANLDKLFWLLARFQGYAGLVNNMGARFTASGTDLAPIMEEIGLRGLGYIDDGSSNRSLAGQLASGNAVPFVRADQTIDDNPDRAAILAALAKLEGQARQSGSAIGLSSALPVSIAVLSEWSATLAAKGITLVPISALMRDEN